MKVLTGGNAKVKRIRKATINAKPATPIVFLIVAVLVSDANKR